jgi:hypothetical protein
MDLDTSITEPAAEGRATRYRFPSGAFGMVGDDGAKALAGDTEIPSYMRLLFACFAKANVNGHCRFEPGEMKRLLAGNDGEPAQRSGIRYALGKLKAWGIIAPESTARCVVLDSVLYRRADNRHWSCDTHRDHPDLKGDHSDLKWVHGLGWEGHAGEWDEWLHRPEAREMITGQLRSAA